MGAFEWSGQTNDMELSLAPNMLDATVLGAAGTTPGSLIRAAGLIDGTFTAKGFNDFLGGGTPTNSIDFQMYTSIGVLDVPLTASEMQCAEGDKAYFLPVVEGTYSIAATPVGQLLPYSATAHTRGRIIDGTVVLSPLANKTSTGSATSQNLGAVSATQKVYAALHVLSVAGTSTPTITCIVRSAAAANMSGPTTRISFTAATATGGQLLSTAGAITDTWWDVQYTISGSSPSFQAICTVGIL
jgi:hypothetical protein